MNAVHSFFEWYFRHVKLPLSKDLNGAFSYDPTDRTYLHKCNAYVEEMEMFFANLLGDMALRHLVDSKQFPNILYQKRWDMLLKRDVSLLSDPTDSVNLIPCEQLDGPFLNSKKNHLTPLGGWLRSLW